MGIRDLLRRRSESVGQQVCMAHPWEAPHHGFTHWPGPPSWARQRVGDGRGDWLRDDNGDFVLKEVRCDGQPISLDSPDFLPFLRQHVREPGPVEDMIRQVLTHEMGGLVPSAQLGVAVERIIEVA